MKEKQHLLAGLVALVLLVPSLASAQAWVPPKGEGSFALTVQSLDAGNHLLPSSVFAGVDFGSKTVDLGKMEGRVLVLDGDFGLTGKLAVSASVAHVASRFTDGGRNRDLPAVHLDLPIDDGNWHSSLQDARIALRYMQPKGAWVFTPSAAIVFPLRDYVTLGHANIGRGLNELQLGIDVGRILPNSNRPRAYVQGAYRYAFIEKLGDTSLEQGNLLLELGYLAHPRLTVRGFGDWRTSHHDSGANAFHLHDQLLAVEWLRLGVGLSIPLAEGFDFFASVAKTIEGENTHDGTTFSIGTTWGFHAPGSGRGKIRFPG
ncbi:MAG: hypothetical protein V3S30_03275 [Thermoanaerobaculia bacterium]